MKSRLLTGMLILAMSASLLFSSGCQSTGSSTPTAESESATPASDTAPHTPEEKPADVAQATVNVELSNTYTTKFGDVNAITYPPFSFDYPSGWTVAEETVDASSERVTLKNDRGVSVTYWRFGLMKDLTGPIRGANSLDVSKIADSQFVPGYVQATDYSSLGTFMVAKLKTTSETDMLGDGKSVAVDGAVRYAVLPESEAGEYIETSIVGLPTLSFWYSGHLSFVAEAPDGNFTVQEEKEVTAILASFRDEDALALTPNENIDPAAGGHTAASIDELWAMLGGTWRLEEYTFSGSKANYPQQHNIEFKYVDNKPCISNDYQSEGGHIPDKFFYDIASIDASNYDVYTYKRGHFGGEGDNWSSDVRLVWYSFDLTNLDNGEIVLTYKIAQDNGFIDDNNVFKYKRL